MSPEHTQPYPADSISPRRKNSLLVLAAWLFLGALALAVALVMPLVVDLQPRPDLALDLFGSGLVLVLVSLVRRLRAARWIGAAVLWLEVALCLLTQISPFGTPLGVALGRPAVLLIWSILLWSMCLQPTGWVQDGLWAVGVVTLLVIGAAWITSPRIWFTVTNSWLAVDSHDRLYAAESDLGVIWVFDPGGMRSTLWPRRAPAGQTGPGLQPAGMSDIAQPSLAGSVAQDPFDLQICGLALDPQDELYVIDPQLYLIQQFSKDGYQTRAWALPSGYLPADGCLAADSERVYVLDEMGFIDVFDHTGKMLEQTRIAPYPMGEAIGTADGQLYVLKGDTLRVYQYPGGQVVREIALSKQDPNSLNASGPFLVRSNGNILAASLQQVYEFNPEGKQVGVWGQMGDWPGQYAGAGGMPGDLRAVGGLAENRQHRIYVSDKGYRVIQRFRPDGQVDAVITASESEANEMRRLLCPTLFCASPY